MGIQVRMVLKKGGHEYKKKEGAAKAAKTEKVKVRKDRGQ